jgi:hypothetical protein
MKACGNCGHKNADDATRCIECGWVVPKLHPLFKVGRYTKTVAAVLMVLLVVLHVAGYFIPGVGEGERYESYPLYSWLFFLYGMGVATAMYWVGDFLKRSY